jgi:hypothetical protein
MLRFGVLLGLSLALVAAPACGDDGASSVSTTSDATGGGSTGSGSTGSGSTGDGSTSGEATSTGAPTSGEASSTGGSTGDASSTGGSTGGAVGPGCAEHVSFAALEATIFSGCGGYIACHEKGPFGGGLDLTPGQAYAALVGVASTIAPGELRVAAGDSAGSLLYRKLIDDLAGDLSEGGPMPKTATMMMWAKLPDAQIEQVRCWIDEGAPND